MTVEQPNWSKFYSVARDMLMDFEAAMDVYEFKIAWFIFKRTLVYGKEWETIPLRHFVHGVYAEDGAQIAAPCGIDEKTILRSLKHLKAKGLIQVRIQAMGANRYRLTPADDVDVAHVDAYLRKNQPKLIAHRQTALQEMMRRSLVIRHPEIRGRGTPVYGGGVPGNTGEYNRENSNREILKVPAQGAGEITSPSRRNIRIRKG